ncbi:MAG: hypothetical protein AB7L13_03775 [Acidimicrobiia bacterium]
MIAYLSEEWIDSLGAAAATITGLTVEPLAITVAVDAITYHLAWTGTRAEAGRGPAVGETIRLTLDAATARAIARGDLSSQRAFVSGAIRASGRADALMEARALFEALDAALVPLRSATAVVDTLGTTDA